MFYATIGSSRWVSRNAFARPCDPITSKKQASFFSGMKQTGKKPSLIYFFGKKSKMHHHCILLESSSNCRRKSVPFLNKTCFASSFFPLKSHYSTPFSLLQSLLPRLFRKWFSVCQSRRPCSLQNPLLWVPSFWFSSSAFWAFIPCISLTLFRPLSLPIMRLTSAKFSFPLPQIPPSPPTSVTSPCTRTSPEQNLAPTPPVMFSTISETWAFRPTL